MRTSRTFRALCGSRRPIVLAAGFFDGLHLGHRAVLETAVTRARAIDGAAWVLTFDRHPLAVLAPGKAPPAISSRRETLEGFRRMGFEGCLMLPFSRALAGLEPADFVNRLTACRPALAHVVVGRNWRFGRGGAGTPALLATLGRRIGFGVTVVKPVLHAGRPISSTRLRAAIGAGRVDSASALLGRPFSLEGRVVHGRGVGRSLGFPTANLQWTDRVGLRPANGVYAVLARIGNRTLGGMLNIGQRPTFGNTSSGTPVAELYLFDFAGSLYGRNVKVAFLRRLRAERRFPSPAMLQTQLQHDEKHARKALKQASAQNAKEWLYTGRGIKI